MAPSWRALEGGNRGPEIHAFSGGRGLALTKVNDAFHSRVALGAKETVSFKSADGTEVQAFVTKPPGFVSGRRYPTILHIHGGPVGQFGWGFDFKPQYFAANGYVVIEPNPRGSTGRGQEFVRAIYQTWGITDYDDLIAAVDYAIAAGYADPDRLAVTGYSYGGYMTNTVITRTDRFKAAASGAGHSYIAANYGHDIYQKWYNWELGPPWENREKYDRLSPLLQAGKVTTPTIFLGGREDWNVPLLNAELFYQSLRKRGIDTELVVYPGMHHGGWDPEFEQRLPRACAGVVRQVPEVTAKASFEKALEALRVNRPHSAEAICREYLVESPGSVNHLRLLGHALMKQARYAEAEQVVRQAIALKPEFPHLHEDLGSIFAMQHRYAEAEPCFREAIRLEPRLPLAHRKLGEALAMLGRGLEAEAAFEEFFEQDLDKGRVAASLDHMRAGRKAEAIEALRGALRESPDNVDAMRCLAHIYIQDRERLSDAEALLRNATSMAPDYAAAWMLLGGLLHELGRHAESVQAFSRVTELEPRNAAAWTALGNARAFAGDIEPVPRSICAGGFIGAGSARRPDGTWATCSRRSVTRPARCARTGPRSPRSLTSAKCTGAWPI